MNDERGSCEDSYETGRDNRPTEHHVSKEKASRIHGRREGQDRFGFGDGDH